MERLLFMLAALLSLIGAGTAWASSTIGQLANHSASPTTLCAGTRLIPSSQR